MQVSFTLKLDYKILLKYVVELFLKTRNFNTLGSVFKLYTTLLKQTFLDFSFSHRGIGKFDCLDCQIVRLSSTSLVISKMYTVLR